MADVMAAVAVHKAIGYDTAVTEAIGYAGTVLLSLTLVPQLVKTVRDRTAAGLATGFLLAQGASCLIFIVYAYRLGAAPVLTQSVTCNAVVLFNCLALLALRVYFGRNSQTDLERGPLLPIYE